MMRRPVRILVLLLTVAVTVGVVWRATTNEQARARMRLAAQQSDAAAADTIFQLVDLRSSLHAYVAPGQGIDFWSARAQGQLDDLNTRLHDLDAATSAAGHPLGTALGSLEGLAAAEKRARTAVGDGQMLIAGDILFAETGGLIDTAARDVSDARQAMARAQSTREGAWANEQSLLAGGLIAVWIFALTVLVPVPAVRPVEVPSSLSLNERARPQLEEDVAASASPQADQGASPVNEPGPVVPPDAEKRTGDQSAASSSAPVDGVETQRDTTAAVFLETAARLCTDIGRVAEASDLGPLLGRTATLLGATGVVVWLVAPDGQRLVPAMAHGYDDAQLGRMGSIGADDDNLTATAFRTSRATHASANGHVPGAVAVPILSASGTSGVLAAEVPEGTDLSRAEAVAALVAAQLAGMFPAVNPGNIPKSEVANERSEASSEA